MSRATAILAIGCLLFGAACGEKVEETETTSTDEFLASGDEICRESQAKLEESASAIGTMAEDLAALLKIYEEEVARLGELEPPDELADEFDAYLREREASLKTIRDAELLAQKDPLAAVDVMSQVTAGQVKRTELADAVGFSDCSRPESAVDE